MTTKTRKKQSAVDRFLALTDSERDAETAKFDEEFVESTTRELTPKEKAQWGRTKPKIGRPKIGGGVKVISVSMETGLLSKTDRLAKKLKMSRAQVIAMGINRMIGSVNLGAPIPSKPSARAAYTIAAKRKK